ncbi:hypothetical protein Tco_0379202 [Tanacetum coccineum]
MPTSIMRETMSIAKAQAVRAQSWDVASHHVIMEYLVKISKKARILELKQRNMKINDLDIQYSVSIKEDTTYLCLHITKDHKGNKINMPYLGKTNTPYSRYRM